MAITKTENKVKRMAKTSRNNQTVLYAERSGEISGEFLTLKDNSTFTYKRGIGFYWENYAGIWYHDKNSDTIRFQYYLDYKPKNIDTIAVFIKNPNSSDSVNCSLCRYDNILIPITNTDSRIRWLKLYVLENQIIID